MAHVHVRDRIATFLHSERLEVAGTRTVIVAISPLLADLIQRLAEGHIHLEIIAVLENRISLMERLQSLAPALILLGLDAGEDDSFATTLAERVPGVRVLAFARDVSHVSVHEAGKSARALVDPSRGELIAALVGDLDPAANGM